jgi:hypothetical protein
MAAMKGWGRNASGLKRFRRGLKLHSKKGRVYIVISSRIQGHARRESKTSERASKMESKDER